MMLDDSISKGDIRLKTIGIFRVCRISIGTMGLLPGQDQSSGGVPVVATSDLRLWGNSGCIR